MAQSVMTDTAGRLQYLVAEDIRVAASLLYQAYRDDPVLCTIFRVQEDGYEQRLRSAIREELNVFCQYQQPMIGYYVGDTLEGVVCLTQPEAGFGPGRLWHWRLRMLLTAGYLSTRQMVEKERIIQQAVPFTHYYLLSFIAVHPRYQHQGLGHLLLKAVGTVLHADSEAEGVAVLATRPQYVEFFSREGYESIARLDSDPVQGELMIFQRTATQVAREGSYAI